MADRLNAKIRGIAPLAAGWRPENLVDIGGGLLDSSYQEKDPRPGTAVIDDSRARLRPEVSQAQTTGTLVVKVTEGGLPGPAGAAVSYRQAKDAVDNARGWNQPNYLQGWLAQEWSDVNIYNDFACVTIPSTQNVIGFSQVNGGANFLATTRTFDPEGWSWSASAPVPWAAATGVDAVALVHLPGTDRTLAILMPSNALGRGVMEVWSSEDSGSTWEEYSLRPIRDPAADESGSGFGVGVSRAKAAALTDGSVVVVVQRGGGSDQIAQLASADLGVTFALVEPALLLGTNIDVFALPDGSVAITYIEESTLLPRIRIIASVFDPISAATEVSIGGAQLSSMTATVDHDGTIYVFGQRETNFARMKVYFSTDSGRSWTEFDWGLIDTGDNAAYPILKGCCATCGYIILQHQWSSSVGDEDGSVGTIIAGGWTNATAVDSGYFSISLSGLPRDGPAQFERFGYGPKIGEESNSWLPIERPSETIYTAGGALGVLEAPGRLNMSSINVGVDSMTFQTATGIKDCVIKADLDCTSLGSQAAMVVGFDAEISDPGVPRSFRIQIRVDTAGFAVHNVHAAADIGTVTIDMTTPLQIALHFVFDSTGTIGNVHTYYRRPSALWTAGPTGSNVTKAAAAANLSRFVFVHHVATLSVSHWQMFAWAFDGGIAFGEDKIDGKRLSDLPYPLLNAGNMVTEEKAFLSLRSGPGVRGEVYNIAAEADHGVHKAFPSVSPSRDETWENTSDSTPQKLSVDMGFDTRLGQSFALVVAVLNANARFHRVLGDIGGVPTLIGTVDLATGFDGLDYVLSGDQMFPNTATTPDAGRWIQSMEFAGGHVLLPAGSTGAGLARKIIGNSAGGWTQKVTVQPHFQLEGITGAEAAAGTCTIVAPSGVMVCHLATTAATFRRHFQIEIAAQDTAENRFIVGNYLLGGLTAWGKSNSSGWSLQQRPNARIRRDPYGTEYRQQRGPEQGAYTLGWPDGVKWHALRGTDLGADYIGSSVPGASALAARDDVWGQLVGLLKASGGFSAPSILLTDVPDASGVTVTDPTLWLYGYVTANLQANNVLGNENIDEYMRIESITFDEIR